MVEGNDQSLEYIGYQVPRSELEANAEDFEKSNQTQGFNFNFNFNLFI